MPSAPLEPLESGTSEESGPGRHGVAFWDVVTELCTVSSQLQKALNKVVRQRGQVRGPTRSSALARLSRWSLTPHGRRGRRPSSTSMRAVPRVEVLFNNVGGGSHTLPELMEFDEFADKLGVNLHSSFLTRRVSDGP